MFRTELHIGPNDHKITLDTPILSIGSCFSNCIGERLAANKFKTLVNPFGIIFNPLSIGKLLQYAIENRMPEDQTYLENQSVFRNYDFHSDFSDISKASLKAKVEKTIHHAGNFLRSAEWLTITPGTAFVYELKENNHTVANCHKMPPALFTKKLLKVEEIIFNFSQLYERIKKINPRLKFILTVSPVRHIKDTIDLNSMSKSVLRLAWGQLAARYEEVDYFPSYEIMMDDLRDYRFYKADMLHPTEVAENYIWEKFSQRYFDQETITFLEAWQKIKNAIRHKPFHPDSQAHQQFISQTIHQLKSLSHQIDVSDEIALLKKQLR